MSDTPTGRNPSGPFPPDLERPAGGIATGGPRYGSDVAAETLRALDIPFVALNPGSSYRGLHDSIVNHLGNDRPRMLVCLHEESAVALAHGWAKVTGRPMAARSTSSSAPWMTSRCRSDRVRSSAVVGATPTAAARSRLVRRASR